MDKYPLGTRLVIANNVLGDPEHKLHGAEVTVVEEGVETSDFEEKGYRYRVKLCKGFDHCWQVPQFYLYHRSLLPALIELGAEDLQAMREELKEQLNELRQEVS